MGISEKARDLFEFKNNLISIGFKEDLIAEIIRKFGDVIPVFGSQLQGFYVRPDGRRDPHFAVHGWYSILKVEGNSVWIKKLYHETADVFHCGTFWIPSTVGANMEMMDKGHPSPDSGYNPVGM